MAELYPALVAALAPSASPTCTSCTSVTRRSCAASATAGRRVLCSTEPAPTSIAVPRTCDDGLADAVSVGALALANPDVVARIAGDAPMNEPDRATLYGGGAQGYTDYPRLAA